MKMTLHKMSTNMDAHLRHFSFAGQEFFICENEFQQTEQRFKALKYFKSYRLLYVPQNASKQLLFCKTKYSE